MLSFFMLQGWPFQSVKTGYVFQLSRQNSLSLILRLLFSQTFSRMKKLHVAIFIIKTTLQPPPVDACLGKVFKLYVRVL